MAKIEAGQLNITRSSTGVWSIAPKSDRNWRTPVTIGQARSEYGSDTLSLDYAGVSGRAQRFTATVGIINVRNYDNMDGFLKSFFFEVRIVQRFRFEWPIEQDHIFVGASPRNSTKGAVGDNAVRMSAGTPPKVGSWLKFGADGKLHNVQYAPSGDQTSAYDVGIYPSLIAPVASGTTAIVKNVDSLARLVATPQRVLNNGIVTEAVIVVREALS